MEIIIKRILFVQYLLVFFFLLVDDRHLASELRTAPTATETSGTYSNSDPMRRWIQEQINGTVNLCADILGTTWKNDANKTVHPNASQPFNVCVPKKAAFPEFINVSKEGELKGGFSIAMFCLALQELPFKIQHVFKLINESYTEVVHKLEVQDCDVVAGDITITLNRTKYADFTIPYMGSKIYMLVPAKQNWKQAVFTLFRPFTMRLWIAIIISCMIIGLSIGYLEYREQNPSFYNVPLDQKLFMVIWFPISKIFFQEGRIHNKCSKLVLVTWLTTIFIVMQIFTAGLSSWLTVNQLQPKVPKQYQVVGYQSGSFIVDFVEDRARRSGTTTMELALSSVDDYKNALDNGTVGAICDEDPYINLFLDKYKDNYMKVGPLADEPGLGFAFSRGSPLQQSFSNAIIKITESPNMVEMKNRYLGTQTPSTRPDDDSAPQRLDIHSFFLLFLFMGVATTIAIIISEISLMHNDTTSNESREMVTMSENSIQNAK